MATLFGIMIVIGGVIFIHELGHYTFAKLTGMRVETFSLGFPPKIFGKKIGETEYCISAIPIGGYVKVTGVIDESMDTEGAKSEESFSFANKNTLQKALFITGGVIFNVILAFVVFSIITATNGIYEPRPESIVDQVVPDYPAEKAGIMSNDEIISVNGINTPTWKEMTNIIHAHPKQKISIEWSRNGEMFSADLVTEATKIVEGGEFKEVGVIGISASTIKKDATFLQCLNNGWKQTYYWLKIDFISLKALISGKESMKNIGGPILIARLAGETAKSGLSNLFALMAIISVNLGLINILPIPALDGGHLVVVLIEGIIKKPLSLKIKLRIQQVGLAIILSLIVLVLYNDITRWIQGF